MHEGVHRHQHLIWAYRFDQRELEKRTRIEQWLRMCHILAETQQLSWFDALIAEAAIRSGCRFLRSEDFGHGRRIGTVEVRNPFQNPDF